MPSDCLLLGSFGIAAMTMSGNGRDLIPFAIAVMTMRLLHSLV